ncbi:hypothetical protein ACTJJ0_03475 [Chitinophaga sp. 22321]|uniref:HNH endonuclease n=1 Tax=Chitinophaga hostae TaxID=2831022 RepID=A0ABS5IXY2_9BACT|nr:hypothetical protein [Chitinophaga hostae]MBS0027703.1 hypothetical protein [Chitinophaga hostae]
MIKVPLTLDQLDDLAQEFGRLIIKNIPIKKKLRRKPKPTYLGEVFQYLEANLEDILIGRLDRLENHIAQLEPKIVLAMNRYRGRYPRKTAKDAKKWFNKIILSIWNYDRNNYSFTLKNKGELAYNHAKNIGTNTCLYCNAQYTITLKKGAQKTRPTFDHFYGKADYPYLALSFYNLIPACYVCNSNLKRDTLVQPGEYLHPFIYGFDNLLAFSIKVNALDFLINREKFALDLIPCPGADPDRLEQANRNKELFALKERYNYDLSHVQDILTKSYLYSNSAIKDLKDFKIDGKYLFHSEEEVKELIFGASGRPDKHHKRIFSKLTKDISLELGLDL